MMTTTAQIAFKDIPCLHRHLEDLVAVSAGAFIPPPGFDPQNHLAFMALTFAVKQNEHARSVLQLDQSVDAVLITRSMFEGLSQLLWAGQAPQERPLRWRAFPFILDWRRMRRQLVAGQAVPDERQRAIAEGLRRHGEYFLTPRALDAQARGLPLPDDPYAKNWYGENEKDIFTAAGADRIYDEVYGPFSEWHHWRPGAFGHLLQFDEACTTFMMDTRNPSFTAMALAGGFQCLWQTMSFLENILLGRLRADLDRLYESYVEIEKR